MAPEDRICRPAPSSSIVLNMPQMNTLRVIAMFGIFFHHLGMTVLRDPDTLVERVVHDIVYLGADGVIFFNIISGFLLAFPYLGPARRSFPGYGVFLKRRFLRILPAYYLVLLVFSVANVFAFDFPATSSLRYMLEHALFLNTLDYETLGLNISPFWYVGMLVHFYLVFPFALRLFLGFGPTWAALSIIVVSWGTCGLVFLYLAAHPDSVFGMAGSLMFFNLPARLPEFTIGMWLAAIWNPAGSCGRESGLNRPFTFLLAGMVLHALVSAPFIERMDSLSFHILSVSAVVPVFMLLFLWSPTSDAAGFPAVGKLAKYSFGIFMVHHPLFSYLGVMPGKVPGTVAELVKLAFLMFPLCYVAAVLLDRLAGLVVSIPRGR
jgi:peptidoglycan/LPS O-acetylase OafA/YrhL